MKLFDSHAHLTHILFDDDREAVIKKLRDSDIKVINIGNDLEDSKKTVALAKKYPDQMWASVGIHPDGAKNNFNYGELKDLAKDESVVAIGECGLDYFRNTDKKIIERQKDLFIEQINLAKELNKPLILHCRPTAKTQDAYDDALDVFATCDMSLVTGNGTVHFFSGSREIAKKFLELGFFISFAGPITFSGSYEEIVKYVPMDRILIETDSPFAAPIPYRGKRNEPIFVEFVVRRIAEWKRLDFETVAEQTAKNAVKLFCL